MEREPALERLHPEPVMRPAAGSMVIALFAAATLAGFEIGQMAIPRPSVPGEGIAGAQRRAAPSSARAAAPRTPAPWNVQDVLGSSLSVVGPALLVTGICALPAGHLEALHIRSRPHALLVLLAGGALVLLGRALSSTSAAMLGWILSFVLQALTLLLAALLTLLKGRVDRFGIRSRRQAVLALGLGFVLLLAGRVAASVYEGTVGPLLVASARHPGADGVPGATKDLRATPAVGKGAPGRSLAPARARAAWATPESGEARRSHGPAERPTRVSPTLLERQRYVDRLNANFTRRGWAAWVTLEGDDQTTIRLRYVLWNWPLIRAYLKDSTLIAPPDRLKRLGFRRLIFDAGDRRFAVDIAE